MSAPLNQCQPDNASELLPCPFCGGEPQQVCGGPGNWCVRCVNCNAASDDGVRDGATAAWNTRAPAMTDHTTRPELEREAIASELSRFFPGKQWLRDKAAVAILALKAPAPHQSSGVQSADDIRWAVNVLLEKIAEKFDQWDTHDIWRSDAAATVRGFKHDLAALSPERAKSEPTDEEIETDMHYIRNQLAMKRDSEAHRMLREQFGSPAVSSAESKSHG